MFPNGMRRLDKGRLQFYPVRNERAAVGYFHWGKDHMQFPVFRKVGRQRIRAALERPHFSRAVGRRLASYEVDLSEPGVREVIILCLFDIPFQPVFFLGKKLFFTRQEIDAHIEIQAFITAFVAAAAAAGCRAKLPAVTGQRAHTIQQAIDGLVCCFSDSAFHNKGIITCSLAL